MTCWTVAGTKHAAFLQNQTADLLIHFLFVHPYGFHILVIGFLAWLIQCWPISDWLLLEREKIGEYPCVTVLLRLSRLTKVAQNYLMSWSMSSPLLRGLLLPVLGGASEFLSANFIYVLVVAFCHIRLVERFQSILHAIYTLLTHYK